MPFQNELLSLKQHLESVIVGQTQLIDNLLIALLSGGHILLESAPGLAKTTAIKALASGVHASFQRIQFTPDLMPSDITGNDIYEPDNGRFRFVQGPLFNEIILADEINRAPPKVQSALLEAMEEHHVTVNGQSHNLPELFIVLATQNPLEQAGTYPLPEAQLDRFMLHVVVSYPNAEEELEILERDMKKQIKQSSNAATTPLSPEMVLTARQEVAETHIEDSIKQYVVALVTATRNAESVDSELKDMIQYGASPRATLACIRAAKAHAYLADRDFVTPDDITAVIHNILRHRIISSFNARAAQLSHDELISKIIKAVPMP